MKKILSIILAFVLAISTSPAAGQDGTTISSTAYEASHILLAGGGVLVGLVGYNSGSAQFIQVFNSTTLPANASVPIITFTVAATSNFSVTLPGTGIPFSTGIVVCNSSTGPTKTIGTTDCWFTAVVR